MNDISVKIEESPKSPRDIAVSPSTLAGTENEFDPLSIEEEVGAVKEPVVEEKPVKAGNCDDDAKEKTSKVQNGEAEEVKSLETEVIKEDVQLPSPVEVAIKEEVTVPEISSVKTVETPETTEKPVKEESEPQITIEPVPTPEKVIEKEPSPVKEVEIEEPDQEMTEVAKVEEEIEQKVEQKSKTPMNGDIPKDEQGTKRRSSEEVETESPLKKLCQEVEKTFPHHDAMINDYIQTATKNNVDEVQRHTEQLLSEIQTLRELAQKKEHEWNSILHLKKVKEEILLRLLRRKQVLSYEKSEVNGQDPFEYLNQAKNLAIDKSDEISGLAIKQPGASVNPMMQPPVMPMSSYNPMSGLPPPYDKAHLQNMPKPVFPQQLMLPGPLQGFPRDMNGQLPSYGLPMGRQGPTKDVKSIIADYRQRNPDVTPRRGRRMKSILNPNMMNSPRPIAPKMDSLNNLSNLANMTNMNNLSNMANLNNINMIFNTLDMNQKAMLERLQQVQGGAMQNGMSFKDVLVQFANMQHTNPSLVPNRVENIPIRPEQRPERPDNRRRPERPDRAHDEQAHKPERLASSPRLPPPPYPEISLLPVSGAEPAQQQNSLLHGILTKNCGEITITPVQPTPPPPESQPEKTEEVVQLDDEESPASEGEACPSPAGSGRLVIDEGGAPEPEPAAEPETPQCQGCRRKDAQFVCAGCANQWYCSRSCQVAAWDDHSEMCSG